MTLKELHHQEAHPSMAPTRDRGIPVQLAGSSTGDSPSIDHFPAFCNPREAPAVSQISIALL